MTGCKMLIHQRKRVFTALEVGYKRQLKPFPKQWIIQYLILLGCGAWMISGAALSELILLEWNRYRMRPCGAE